ncbi:G6PD [Lepeophtheirus salmonis]|uniref:Glucose-6-phosphate 1-dehydrogenase n=1 Tax=Lepeophtheirus salmonis TaxID=72036 RepID=A0A7R8CM58_LEPSM|nr:G6PD [Lepeophtheirus salmonis]CAF2863366.1 G6PD [Lepeophtheirus salmonis]
MVSTWVRCRVIVLLSHHFLEIVAKKKFIQLFGPYISQSVSPKYKIHCYSRSKIDVKTIREKSAPWVICKEENKAKVEDFWSLNYYVAPKLRSKRDFELLKLKKWNDSKLDTVGSIVCLILLFLRLSFAPVTVLIKECCMSSKGMESSSLLKSHLERNSASSAELSHHLSSLFREDQYIVLSIILERNGSKSYYTSICPIDL